MKTEIEPSPDKGAAGVHGGGAKQAGDFVADDIAEDTTESAGEDSEEGSDDDGNVGFESGGGPGNAEESETEGVRDSKVFFQAGDPVGANGAEEGEGKEEDDVVAIGDPEEGMAIEAEVTQGAAAEGDDEGDGEEADEVHVLLVGAGDAVEGEGDDTAEFNRLEHRQKNTNSLH